MTTGPRQSGSRVAVTRKPTVPWEFSEPSAEGDGVPNAPTPEGRLLGEQLARLADHEEAILRERFPHAHRRCGDCALRAGTTPNGCAETLMDVVKALVEHVPFYCHKAMTPDGEPRVLCAGYAILAGTDLTDALSEESG